MADGTIRWHRMADGVELLAFMPLANQKDWVAWTPEGFYDATPGAQGVLRWHVNHGWDAPATDVPVADIPGSYRPNVLPLVLQQLETPRALGLAVLAEHNEEVRRRTNSHVPPGTRLHLLSRRRRHLPAGRSSAPEIRRPRRGKPRERDQDDAGTALYGGSKVAAQSGRQQDGDHGRPGVDRPAYGSRRRQ